MKRSEMARAISIVLEGYMYDNLAQRRAEEVLRMIEQAGMIPPPLKKPHTIRIPCTDGSYIEHATTITSREWEDEE
jgi:hypothetical protein